MDIQHLVIEIKKSGMTQQEIAAFVKCSQSTISDIETGTIGKARPSWKIVDGLTRLADERGIDLADKQ